MARKKDSESSVSPEEDAEVQRLLGEFPTIAQALYASRDAEQAQAALTPITHAAESVQIALIKALSREQEIAAADVLLALHTFNPSKEGRKEARRSLIRLEAAKLYPQWTPPVTPPIGVSSTNPPRFWKGLVSEMREQGEIDIILCWEQGIDHNEARMLAFLLDFWNEGVKDFVSEVGSKRSIETRIDKKREQTENVQYVDCTLAEGRRLVEEALAVNAWRKTAPHKDYRHHLATVRQLLLNVTDLGEDHGRTFIDPKLEPDEVALNAIGAWSLGDYGLAYDFLTRGSDLREGLDRAEWVERRRAWANEAKPARLELGFAHEREVTQSALWLPTTAINSRNAGRKEVEVGWSLEVSETPLSGTLKEMPLGTVVNKDTGRHWFWTSYTLAQEQGVWRIQNMTDEGAKVQGLSIDELQKRIKEQDDRINTLVQEQQNPRILSQEDYNEALEEIMRRMIQAMHYDDALLVKLPLDPSVYDSAYSHALAIRSLERVAAYLSRMAQRFPDKRVPALQELGNTQASLAEAFSERNMHDQSERFFALAEKTMREVLVIADNASAYIMLAQLLGSDAERVDEARALLQQALQHKPSPLEETIIEASFGDMASRSRQFEEALRYYQRAASIRADYPNIWLAIGLTQQQLKRFDDAKTSFRRALEADPSNMRAYGELVNLYVSDREFTRAREQLEQGIRLLPGSGHLRTLLSSVYYEMGDQQAARRYLQEAERIEPGLPSVQAMSELLNPSGAGRKR